MLRRLYSLIMLIAYPLLLLYTLNKSRQEPRYRQNLSERLGFAPQLDGCIWIHCVSLGETIAAKPLIVKLQQHYPDTPLLITNTTATGSLAADGLLRDMDRRCFLPYDTNGSMRRFFNRTRPKVGIIMETELWPNLFHQAKKHNIPTIVNNARLSARSAKGYQRIHSIMREILTNVSCINSQTQDDADRFIALGLDPAKSRVSGNLKFDLTLAADLPETARALRESWGPEPIWIAASSHAGEEELILQAHTLIRKRCPQARLLLVPRHPNRFDEVYDLTKQHGFATARFSETAAVTDQPVILGDAMGKMMVFFAATDIVFMCGSLAPIGGHNFIEPAVLSKPLISGRHLHNFSQISQQLIKKDALILAETAEKIADTVVHLIQNEEECRVRGSRAKALAAQNTGACEKQLACVQELMGPALK